MIIRFFILLMVATLSIYNTIMVRRLLRKEKQREEEIN